MFDIIPFEIYIHGGVAYPYQPSQFGFWEYLIKKDNDIIEKGGGAQFGFFSTRMQVLAANVSLKRVMSMRKEKQDIYLHTMDKFIQDVYFKEWYKGWIKFGWTNQSENSIANRDLWEELVPFFKKKYFYLIGQQPNEMGWQIEQMSSIQNFIMKQMEEKWLKGDKRPLWL